MTLLGMSIEDAHKVLKEWGYEGEFVQYFGTKPYKDADSKRVVRVKKINKKRYQLVYCNFKSVPNTDSQGS